MPTALVDDAAAPVSAAAAGAQAYEQRLRDTASAQERTSRLAEAAITWEILTIIKPDSVEYRDRLREVRRSADVSLAEKLARAEAAQKKGDLDTAATQYLGALAFDPSNGRAADGLRAVERERNRRTVLGKPSRLTLTKRAIADSQASSPVSVPLDSNELEYATMLGKQGEYDDAIALLEARIAVDRSDTAARLRLADLYAQKAEKRLPRDRAGAIAALDRGTKLDPSNAAAMLRLKQLKAGAGGVAKPVAAARAASAARSVSAPASAASASTGAARSARAASGPSRAASAASAASRPQAAGLAAPAVASRAASRP